MGVQRASDYKAPGGKLVRIRLEEDDGRIAAVRISGDFFLMPEDALSNLEKELEGSRVRDDELRRLVNRFFESAKVQSLGVTPDDFVRALLLTVTEE